MDSDDDSDIGDILDDLLANGDTNVPPVSSTKKLQELNHNFLDSPDNGDTCENTKITKKSTSIVHEKDVDSSDDEDKRNFEEQKYSDYGRSVKNLLKNDNAAKTFEKSSNVRNDKSSFNFNSEKKKACENGVSAVSKDVYSDPIFGLRMTKPLISSAELVDRMKGRHAVTVSKVKHHVTTERVHDDWVLAGVLINRSPTKTSQKGSQYCIWKLSDLGDKMNTISLFMFSGAYKLFWKTAVGAVVGILNPNVMDSKDNIDEATLSVDNAQKVMIMGNSRDMGKCKSTKKNGEPCSNIVNLSRCEYCVYHVKQEYKRASKRSDLQSNGGAGDFASSMMKKPKTPLSGIYSQGMNQHHQKFTPILAKRNAKLYEKDSARLALLRGTSTMPIMPVKIDNTGDKKKACLVELTSSQIKKDLEKLNKLRGWSGSRPANLAMVSEPRISENSTEIVNSPKIDNSSKIVNSQKIGNLSKIVNSSNIGNSSKIVNSPIPRLGSGSQGGSIDLSQPITKRHTDNARANALRWIRENGNLKKSNPNKIHESKEKKSEAGAKRRREIDEAAEENTKKCKRATINDKFKEMLEAKSSHVDLVEKSQDEEKEKYFEKLEYKEKMEEKMLETYKIDCKAVKCLICKYTAYSASDLCKEEKHPLRIVNAVKSFFKCHDCGNRTTSLDRIPAQSCKKCHGSHWVRAAMMAEKKIEISSVGLSIRGGEEKFIGSVCQDANINLLVPDSGSADS